MSVMSEPHYMTNPTTYDKVAGFSKAIEGEQIIIEYESTQSGMKTIGGEVVASHETYNNREDTRTITIDIESYEGNWRLKAENHRLKEVTLFSYTRVDGEIKTTRISERDGVETVQTATEWKENSDKVDHNEVCHMCDKEATHDVVTTRTVVRLCDECTKAQELAGVVENVQVVGSMPENQLARNN